MTESIGNYTESLFLWLKTFPLSDDVLWNSPSDLNDGVVISRVLHVIDPSYFHAEWLSKIKLDVGENWRLKVSNLKKVVSGISAYYSKLLGQSTAELCPDVSLIGEHGNMDELGRLLQLVLGCAVKCRHKEKYIENIMSMEEQVQHGVMAALQDLMTREAAVGSDPSEQQMKRLVEDLANMTEQKEAMAQRCLELDQQVVSLQEERTSLLAERDNLVEKINHSDNLEDSTTPTGRRYQQLQSQVEQLQDELYKLEAARDDLRIKVELQEKETTELQARNEELAGLAEQARSLKDELDVLKHTEDKVAKHEASIESYKKRLEELGDLKGQIGIVEQKNTSYMTKNMELEEELRKVNVIRSQLDLYKRQCQENQLKLAEETKRADKSEYELKKLQDKVAATEKEKDRLVVERDSLKETNEELSCMSAQKTANSGQLPLDASLDFLTNPAEVKESLLRLQHENKMLKLQRDQHNSDQNQLLQTMFDDTSKRNSELESDIRIAHQRILELESDVEEALKGQTVGGNEAREQELRQKLVKSEGRQTAADAELTTCRDRLSTSDGRCKELEQLNESLNMQLQKKEQEMKLIEERYKKYLDKAKSVIKTLDPKVSTGSSTEILALRNQLQEKDRLIEHLEHEHKKNKDVREQEEKMIVTAWYNLGMQLHRQATEERLSATAHGSSFLARQRQAHSRRMPNTPGSQTPSR